MTAPRAVIGKAKSLQRRPAARFAENGRRSQRRLLMSTVSQGYGARVVRADTADRFLRRLEKLQVCFAKEHRRLYKATYPRITWRQWFDALSCGDIEMYLNKGVRLVAAVEGASNKAVGYVSCIRVESQREGSSSSKAHLKINHVIVSEQHRGKGVGRLLFNRLIEEMERDCPDAVGDLRIIVLEFNVLALTWYWRLGFVVNGIHVGGQKLQSDGEQHPVVYLHMQRRSTAGMLLPDSSMPRRQLFGPELAGVSVAIAPDGSKPASAWRASASEAAASAKSASKGAGGPAAVVLSKEIVKAYDDATGLHLLDSGTSVDLTAKFATGLCRFATPLHELLRKRQPTDLPQPVPSLSTSVATTNCQRRRSVHIV
mmetsp:Transcript_73104/g.174195  ORF Transcript_73104/g.174195 Transcript_73104/m.174195 type:complete len:371 (+) Transcript_73104:89-1201(+)